MSRTPDVPREALEAALHAALAAAREIMDVYRGQFEVQSKPDSSPITEADRRSNALITAYLSERFPRMPFLSEEGAHRPYRERTEWAEYWLVDPLDGTKEFVKRNGEFTINVALMRSIHPVMGVVYVPVTGKLYWGTPAGAWGATWAPPERDPPGLEELERRARRLPFRAEEGGEITAVVSRSHLTPETERYVSYLQHTGRRARALSAGSANKLCLVAEGTADVYPRFGSTWEWDTAAGQAVLEAAGGIMVETETWERFRYNKESLLNPSFIALAPGRDAGYFLHGYRSQVV